MFKHLTMNDVQLEEFPFKRELSMEAYLIENEGVLKLDSDTFSDVSIVVDELTLKQGRTSQGTDGRIDILATYSEEYIAIIELKLGELKQNHLTQLEEYLEEKNQNQILEKYPDILNTEVSLTPKWVGILVGSSIDPDLAEKITKGYSTSDGTPIFALTIKRFRGSDGSVFVITDTFFNKNKTQDTTKYLFEGKEYGKGRLVLAILKDYCSKNNKITYAELDQAFPKKCQGSSGVFAILDEANAVFASTGRKRHFLKPEEVIEIGDATIAVSNQWGIGNINRFIACANKVGYNITTKS